MIDVTFSLEGVDVVSRRLAGLAERAADPISPVADELDKVFAGLMYRAFETAGRSTASGQWAPRKDANPWPILNKTGALFRSLVIGSGDTISVHAPLYWARGTAVPYARYHQSNKPRTKLPRRAFIDLTDADRLALTRPIRVYLTGKQASVTLPNWGEPTP